MKRAPTAKGGLLVEMLVALSIGLGLLTCVATLVISSVRWQRSLVARTEGLEVARTVWVVLGEELRVGRAARDWIVDPTGALDLRAFRGFGRICVEGPGPSLTVAYRGQRLPEATRDSLLVLGPDGEWRPTALTSASSASGGSGCVLEEGELALRLEWEQGNIPEPILVRVFERGSYHLEDGAFRYRRGEGGRQPLTVERLGDGSRFTLLGRTLDVTLEVLSERAGEAPTTFSWRVRDGGPPP